VQDFNHKRLRECGEPVLAVRADNAGPGAAKVESDEAGNLRKVLYLAIGCRVMLLENLWTEAGLVNGSIGTVTDLVWRPGVLDPRKEPPQAVLVKFDRYTGVSISDQQPGVVPILRSTREWLKGQSVCKRSQFPLTLAYAVTVHKSQGVTVEQAVLNISETEFTPSLTYVAVSRVKKLTGLMFEEPFDLLKLRPKGSVSQTERDNDRVARRGQLVRDRLDFNGARGDELGQVDQVGPVGQVGHGGEHGGGHGDDEVDQENQPPADNLLDLIDLDDGFT